MKKLGWALISIGVLAQILIPLKIFDTKFINFLLLPKDIAINFLAMIMTVLGVVVLYFCDLKRRAEVAEREVHERN